MELESTITEKSITSTYPPAQQTYTHLHSVTHHHDHSNIQANAQEAEQNDWRKARTYVFAVIFSIKSNQSNYFKCIYIFLKFVSLDIVCWFNVFVSGCAAVCFKRTVFASPFAFSFSFFADNSFWLFPFTLVRFNLFLIEIDLFVSFEYFCETQVNWVIANALSFWAELTDGFSTKTISHSEFVGGENLSTRKSFSRSSS